MEKFFKKKSEKRQKDWKITESKNDTGEESHLNLNPSRGAYCSNQINKSLLHTNDIRNYERQGKNKHYT